MKRTWNDLALTDEPCTAMGVGGTQAEWATEGMSSDLRVRQVLCPDFTIALCLPIDGIVRNFSVFLSTGSSQDTQLF